MGVLNSQVVPISQVVLRADFTVYIKLLLAHRVVIMVAVYFGHDSVFRWFTFCTFWYHEHTVYFVIWQKDFANSAVIQ